MRTHGKRYRANLEKVDREHAYEPADDEGQQQAPARRALDGEELHALAEQPAGNGHRRRQPRLDAPDPHRHRHHREGEQRADVREVVGLVVVEQRRADRDHDTKSHIEEQVAVGSRVSNGLKNEGGVKSESYATPDQVAFWAKDSGSFHTSIIADELAGKKGKQK